LKLCAAEAAAGFILVAPAWIDKRIQFFQLLAGATGSPATEKLGNQPFAEEETNPP
jgi:hypothetical protein